MRPGSRARKWCGWGRLPHIVVADALTRRHRPREARDETVCDRIVDALGERLRKVRSLGGRRPNDGVANDFTKVVDRVQYRTAARAELASHISPVAGDHP